MGLSAFQFRRRLRILSAMLNQATAGRQTSFDSKYTNEDMHLIIKAVAN